MWTAVVDLGVRWSLMSGCMCDIRAALLVVSLLLGNVFFREVS